MWLQVRRLHSVRIFFDNSTEVEQISNSEKVVDMLRRGCYLPSSLVEK